MNRCQKIVLAGAFANAVVLMLFPPHDAETLMRGTPVFDAFYPVFSAPPNRVINANLLYLSLFAVFGNCALAWLLLSGGKDERPRVSPGNLVVVMAFANLALVFLFPPFEAQPVSGRFGVAAFEGFDFAFGGGARRRIFLPLLYIEVLYVLVNACAFWLALRERAAKTVIDDSIHELIAEKEATEAEIEARVKQGVEQRIREEAKAAGRAAALRKTD
jgi:hypothetical protein